MMQMVYLDPRIEKQIRLLRRGGKKGNLAAEQAEAIIGRLATDAFIPADAGSTTKHGELRIKGCVKYDLGSGYRLLTCKLGDHMFVMFAGSHDDCNRWIENNRELSIEILVSRCQLLANKQPRSRSICGDSTEPVPDPEDDDITIEPDDSQLRAVFSGLAR